MRATEKKIFIHLSLLSLTQKEKQNQSDGKSTAYNSLYMITLSSQSRNTYCYTIQSFKAVTLIDVDRDIKMQ